MLRNLAYQLRSDNNWLIVPLELHNSWQKGSEFINSPPVRRDLGHFLLPDDHRLFTRGEDDQVSLSSEDPPNGKPSREGVQNSAAPSIDKGRLSELKSRTSGGRSQGPTEAPAGEDANAVSRKQENPSDDPMLQSRANWRKGKVRFDWESKLRLTPYESLTPHERKRLRKFSLQRRIEAKQFNREVEEPYKTRRRGRAPWKWLDQEQKNGNTEKTGTERVENSAPKMSPDLTAAGVEDAPTSGTKRQKLMGPTLVTDERNDHVEDHGQGKLGSKVAPTTVNSIAELESPSHALPSMSDAGTNKIFSEMRPAQFHDLSSKLRHSHQSLRQQEGSSTMPTPSALLQRLPTQSQPNRQKTPRMTPQMASLLDIVNREHSMFSQAKRPA